LPAAEKPAGWTAAPALEKTVDGPVGEVAAIAPLQSAFDFTTDDVMSPLRTPSPSTYHVIGLASALGRAGWP